MWVPPECKHPVVFQHPTRKSVGYFGATRLRNGKFVYQREMEAFNAKTFWTFMKELRQISCHNRSPGADINRQCSLAPRQTSRRLARKMHQQVFASVPAALQSRSESNRTRMEAHQAIGNPQSLFRPHRAGIRRSGICLLKMAVSKYNVT